MFKDGKLRLLMTTIGLGRLERDEMSDTNWIIPSTLTSDQLQESLDLLKKYTDDPILFEDGKLSEDFIKRKQKARKTFDSDDEEDNQEEYLFEPGGPTEMKPLEKKPKKLGKKRIRADAEGEEVSDELANEKRKKRLEREREKLLAIKSDMYVHDSDDESDPEKEMEFLSREKMQRESMLKGFAGEITSAPLLVVSTDFEQYPITKKRKKPEKEKRAEKGKKKRKAIQESDEEELVADDDEVDDEAVISREASPLIPNAVYLASDGDESDGPYTIGLVRTSNEEVGSPKAPNNDVVMNDAEDEDEEEDAIPRPNRGRRGPVIIDSDSE